MAALVFPRPGIIQPAPAMVGRAGLGERAGIAGVIQLTALLPVQLHGALVVRMGVQIKPKLPGNEGRLLLLAGAGAGGHPAAGFHGLYQIVKQRALRQRSFI